MDGLLWIVLAVVAAIGIVTWGVVAAISTITRERTRREIMAYVAEGTMTPADAAHLIELAEEADLRKKIISDVSWDGDESYHKTLERILPNRSQKAANAS